MKGLLVNEDESVPRGWVPVFRSFSLLSILVVVIVVITSRRHRLGRRRRHRYRY